MKINLNSITFKVLSLFLLSLILFTSFILLSVKHIFTDSYRDLTYNKISIIQDNIAPEIALNLSYQFYDAINEIGLKQLKNKDILFLKIKSNNPEDKDIIFKKDNTTLSEFKQREEFISNTILIDPSTSTEIGTMIMVYSKKSYQEYMNQFYERFIYAIVLFILAIFVISFILYRSLKPLRFLALSLEKFNPYKAKLIEIDKKNNYEVDTIAKSANIMIDNIIKFSDTTNRLNEELLNKESHLKYAQLIAKVGSWEYDIRTDKLILSDEIYRIYSLKRKHKISWKDFLNFIDADDYVRVIKTINYAIENKSKFDINYSITTDSGKKIYIKTKGKIRNKKDTSSKITAVSMDITKEVNDKKTIEKLAYFDFLTGLANRTLLKDRMLKAIQKAKRDNSKLAVIFLDLDHFKLINDTLGHSVGDELLVYISRLLQDQIRESDTLSRLGGDEFVVFMPSINSSVDAEKIAQKIQKVLEFKHDIGTHQLYITSSLGISLYPEHGENCEELIRNADTAMYEAKNNGRNNYKIYVDSMGNYIDKQMHLEQDLIKAVKSIKEIEVFYQAKIDATNNKISGAEALVRWRHPTKGLIFPNDFIYIAESTGLMIELGNIIIEEAVAQVKEFDKLGFESLKIAINLSPRQFQDANLISFISSMIAKYDVNPAQLEFEITETLSMSNTISALRILNQLKEIGVSIAIDDFGTGHSSLAYLKKFPINTLKIDQSFVMDILDDEDDKTIVQTIITMAHTLGFSTVAEGVETKEHAELLKKIGCDQLQGYHFSKPIAKDEFVEFLTQYK